MSAEDLHPNLGDEQYVTEFTWAYELHIAAAGTTLMRNRKPDTLSPEQLAQRQALLDIDIQLLTAERNKALDKFCAAWTRYRCASV